MGHFCLKNGMDRVLLLLKFGICDLFITEDEVFLSKQAAASGCYPRKYLRYGLFRPPTNLGSILRCCPYVTLRSIICLIILLIFSRLIRSVC